MTDLYLNSLLLGAGAMLLALAAGASAAAAHLGLGPGGRRVLAGFAGASLLMPPFLVANTWLEWTRGQAGGLGRWGGLTIVTLLLGTLLWPVAYATLALTWSRLSAHYLETLPGLRGPRLWQHLLVPSGRPALGVAAVVVLALVWTEFSLPTLFQVRVFTEEFWVRFNTQLDAAGAFRATWPLLGLLALPWALRRRLIRSSGWMLDGVPASGSLWRERLGAGHAWALAGVGMAVLPGVMLPLGRLLASGRTWSGLEPAWRAGGNALANSFVAAAGAATGVVVLGGLLAGLGGRVRRGPVGTWAGFLLPGVMWGVGWIHLLNHAATHWIYQSMGILWLALGLHYLAPAWAIIATGFRMENRDRLDVGRLSGAGRAWLAWRVERPQVAGFLCGAWYLVYLLCLWDVESIVLLVPPGGETVALRIFNLLHYGHAGHVQALCLALMLLGALPACVAVLCLGWVRRWGRRPGPGTWRTLAAGGLLAAGWGGAGCDVRPAAAEEAMASRLFARVEVIGGRGVAPGQFNKPRSLTCDADGFLYVADMTGRIQKFDPEGRFVLQWRVEETDLGKPKGMGLDPAGNILVIEPHYMRVNHFSTDGTLLGRWGRRGLEPGLFVLPRAIGVGTDGDYFISEYTQVDRVQRFAAWVPGTAAGHGDAAGSDGAEEPRFVRTWGQAGPGPGAFGRAEGLCVGPDDQVYVADSCNHRIQVFDGDGRLLRVLGRPGREPGCLSYPYDVRVDADGRVYVCEFGNSRISVLDAGGRCIEVIGGPGAAPGRFANPWSIALDPVGNLYVADSQNHRVQKLVRRDRGRGGVG